MTNPSIADNDPPRRSRARRREAMINAIATVLGCMALVVMIATMVRVVMVKLWESSKVNPEYVQSVYDGEMDRRWSGSSHGATALSLKTAPRFSPATTPASPHLGRLCRSLPAPGSPPPFSSRNFDRRCVQPSRTLKANASRSKPPSVAFLSPTTWSKSSLCPRPTARAPVDGEFLPQSTLELI
jgi:hypothetical protein